MSKRRKSDTMVVGGVRWRITVPTFSKCWAVWVGILSSIGAPATKRVIDALVLSDPGTKRRFELVEERNDGALREAQVLELCRQLSLGKRLSALSWADFPTFDAEGNPATGSAVQDPLWLVLRWLGPHLEGLSAKRLALEARELLWLCELTAFVDGDGRPAEKGDPEGEGSLAKIRETEDRNAWEAALDELVDATGGPVTAARLAVWSYLVTTFPTCTG